MSQSPSSSPTLFAAKLLVALAIAAAGLKLAAGIYLDVQHSREIAQMIQNGRASEFRLRTGGLEFQDYRCKIL